MKGDRVEKGSNMGCFVVPFLLVTFVGLYLLNTYVPKEMQFVVGLVFAAIIIVVVISLRIKHGRPLRY
jgi:hypothetical protein